MKYQVRIHLGIGSILYIKAQLDNVKANYEEILIEPNYKLLKIYRENTKECFEFTTKLVEQLFSEPPYKIVDKVEGGDKDHEDIFTQDWIKPVKPQLARYFCSDNKEIEGDYITLTTKVRYLHRDHYDMIKGDFFKALKNQSKPVVLLGERVMAKNQETNIYGDKQIYSIYDDVMNQGLNVIDKTVDVLYNTPNYDLFKKDCDIMHHAVYNVTLGIGGNFCMATAVGKVVGYRTDGFLVTNMLYDNETYADAFVTKNFNSFLAKLQ